MNTEKVKSRGVPRDLTGPITFIARATSRVYTPGKWQPFCPHCVQATVLSTHVHGLRDVPVITDQTPGGGKTTGVLDGDRSEYVRTCSLPPRLHITSPQDYLILTHCVRATLDFSISLSLSLFCFTHSQPVYFSFFSAFCLPHTLPFYLFPFTLS